MKRHLINTRNHIARYPRAYKKIYQPKKLVEMYDRAIKGWDDETTREQTLNYLSGIEDEALQPHLKGLGDIIHGTDDELFGLLNLSFEEVEGIDGLDGKKLKARIAATKKKVATKKAGVFTAVKNANKKVKTIAKNTVQKGKKFATDASKKALKAVKKVSKAVVKYNPLSLAAKGAFLIGMKTNFGRIASKVYWGYFTKAEALKAGVTEDYYNRAVKAKDTLEKMFVKTLKGNPSAIKKAVVTGRAAKRIKKLASKGKISGLEVLEGLSLGDPATATAITAAIPFLTTVWASIGKLFKGKKGQVNEDGSESPEASSPEGDNDGFSEIEDPSGERNYNNTMKESSGSSSGSGSGSGSGGGSNDKDNGGEEDEDQGTDGSESTSGGGSNKSGQRTIPGAIPKKEFGMGLIITGVAVVGAIALAFGGKSDKPKAIAGTKQHVKKKAAPKKAMKKKTTTKKVHTVNIN